MTWCDGRTEKVRDFFCKGNMLLVVFYKELFFGGGKVPKDSVHLYLWISKKWALSTAARILLVVGEWFVYDTFRNNYEAVSHRLHEVFLPFII